MNEQEEREKNNLSRLVTCEECGAMRVFVESGAVCPNMHGKIWPVLSASQLKASAKRLVWLRMPVLTRIENTRRYMLEGRNEEFIAARKDTEGAIIARYGRKKKRVVKREVKKRTRAKAIAAAGNQEAS